jgi:hypothetical protein
VPRDRKGKFESGWLPERKAKAVRCGNDGPWKAWKTKNGFATFSTALDPDKLRRDSHSHSYGGGYYLNWRGKGNAPPNPQRSHVGQIKPPKWAKRSCQTQTSPKCWQPC